MTKKCDKCNKIADPTKEIKCWKAEKLIKEGDHQNLPEYGDAKCFCVECWEAGSCEKYKDNPRSQTSFKYKIQKGRWTSDKFIGEQIVYWHEDTQEWSWKSPQKDKDKEKEEELQKWKDAHWGLTPNQFYISAIVGGILAFILLIIIFKALFGRSRRRRRY